jgi:hypothetical protein
MVTDPFIVSAADLMRCGRRPALNPRPRATTIQAAFPWLAAAVQATHGILTDELVITVKRDGVNNTISAVLPSFEAELSIRSDSCESVRKG